MQPKNLLVTLAITLSGCGGRGLPPAPKGDLCVIDYARNEISCFPLGEIDKQSDLKLGNIQRNARGGYRLPLSSANKYIAVSPNTWESLQNYADIMAERLSKKAP